MCATVSCMYRGAADENVAIATVNLDELVDELVKYRVNE